LAHRFGFVAWPQRAAVIAAAVLVEQGHIDEGLVGMQEALSQAAALGMKSYPETFSATVLARAHGKAGQPGEGLKILDSLTTTNGVCFYEPEIRRVRGELLLAQDATADAQACFLAAVELASSRQEKSLELRAAMSLARLLRRNGQREAAHVTLARTYGWFSEGLDTADLREARALLAELA
jgi:predicted negative regulator of RcsB-dependent stress response